jgi:DnaJ homolog subfamily C member 19
VKFLFFAAVIAVLFYYGRRFMTPPAPSMDRSEAAKLLGIAPDAGPAEVTEAHRRLIAKVHPDTGGSKELATQVNRARDVMLKP